MVKTGDLNDVKNLTSFNVPNSKGNGAVKTILYDLAVFNKLAMTFIDNSKAVEIRNKFNDVLVKHETNNENNMLPKDYIAALEALLRSEKEKLAMKQEIDNLKAEAGVLSQDYVSNKDVCNELLSLGVAVKKDGTPYAISTLKSKISPRLQALSHENGYSIPEQIVLVEGVERKTPYYHRDVADMVITIRRAEARG